MARIAMLGTGLIGMFYTVALQGKRGRDEVTVVHGRDPERTKAFAEKHGIARWTTDMGEAIRIEELARNLISLARPDAIDPVEIVETGLRPGEKLREELAAAEGVEQVVGSVAVAEKLTAPMPAAAALTVLAPATPPRVSVVLACPLASVTALAGETEPPPEVTVKSTVVPAWGLPLAARTSTTNGWLSAVPTSPL
mgnify:CR=1 FL=1